MALLKLLNNPERDLAGTFEGTTIWARSVLETLEAVSDLSDRLLLNMAARRRMLDCEGSVQRKESR